jgi:glycosyltransferase involved in cell wall biosynthesis
MSENPKVSVIISTYNWPDALSLTISSLLSQSVIPNEIVIADDGSTEETAELIQKLVKESPVPIIHCWHEDKGFRLSRIRNLALSKCSGQYIIQVDGDVICQQDFIKDHLSYAGKGLVLTGRRIDLSQDDTNKSLSSQKLVYRDKNGNKLPTKIRSKILMRLFRPEMTNQFINKGVMGCNMSYWLSDALAVKGYNEQFEGWGKEDDEFIVRLSIIGIQKKTLRFGGLQYHLEHPLQSVASFEKNSRILADTRKGISDHD